MKEEDEVNVTKSCGERKKGWLTKSQFICVWFLWSLYLDDPDLNFLLSPQWRVCERNLWIICMYCWIELEVGGKIEDQSPHRPVLSRYFIDWNLVMDRLRFISSEWSCWDFLSWPGSQFNRLESNLGMENGVKTQGATFRVWIEVCSLDLRYSAHIWL